MGLPSSAFVLLYASLARAPELAMNLASRMTVTAFDARDHTGMQRWSDRHVELKTLFAEQQDDKARS